MRQRLARSVEIVPGDLANAIPARSLRTENDVPLVDPLGNCPQCSARKPRRNLAHVGMAGNHQRYPLLIERAPVFRKLSGQISEFVVVHADEVASKAGLDVRKLAP